MSMRPYGPIDASYYAMGSQSESWSGTSRWQCSCGYQASSQDEHTAAMAPYEPEGAHHQRVR